MRAICGAIITAGALIGLGLTALAFGIRFQGSLIGREGVPKDVGPLLGTPSMLICLVVLLIATVVGLGVAFLGLMYHHERRHFEMHGHHELGRTTSEPVGRVM